MFDKDHVYGGGRTSNVYSFCFYLFFFVVAYEIVSAFKAHPSSHNIMLTLTSTFNAGI